MFKRDSLKTPVAIVVALLFGAASGPAAGLPQVKFATTPAHVVLVVIDGISYKAWDRMDLPVLEEMIATGALVRQVFLPPAAHPHEGAYAKLHTCSIPNPILMAGTIFIEEKTVYVNEQFFPKQTSAFAANAIDYRSLLRNYHLVYQKAGTDEEAMQAATRFVEMGQPAFLSVHLQDTGEGGVASMRGAPGDPWKNNIWHPESPYRRNFTKADSLLGDFIRGLAKLGLLETTAFVVVGDHGQADAGWHPLELWDPAITSAVLWGAGVAAKAMIDYAELIDIAPTVCALMGVTAPSTALGVPIMGALAAKPASPAVLRARLQETMNVQFRDFRVLKADLDAFLAHTEGTAKGWNYSRLNNIVRNFYGIERFIEWPRFKTVEELVEQNGRALENLKKFSGEVLPAPPK